jgi:hypothetical protein
VAAVLDEAAELVIRAVPGWAGLLALTSLPLRFLEVHFINRLIQLGEGAPKYVDHFVSLSWLVTLALIPAFWGRAVYARACSLALSGKTAERGAPLGLCCSWVSDGPSSRCRPWLSSPAWRRPRRRSRSGLVRSRRCRSPCARCAPSRRFSG